MGDINEVKKNLRLDLQYGRISGGHHSANVHALLADHDRLRAALEAVLEHEGDGFHEHGDWCFTEAAERALAPAQQADKETSDG